MAEDKKTTQEEQKPKQKLPIKTIIIIVAIMALEGGAFMAVKIMTAPKPAEAADPIAASTDPVDRGLTEVALTDEMRVDNWVLGGARIIVTLKVVATAEESKTEKLKTLVEENSNQIKDRVNSLVGRAQPDQIRDPDRQVIKREIKNTVEAIVGEGLIKEILLPDYSSVVVD